MSKLPISAGTTSSKSPRSNQQVYSQRSKPPAGFELIEERLNDFKAKMREAEAETTEYKRKTELLWPILRLTHQRTRYVYQMFLKKVISQDVLNYCQQLALIDSGLVSYWKRPGYEHLCCLQCAQKTSQFGGACICRVPANQLATMDPFECKACGCRGCSGVKKPTPPPQQPSQSTNPIDMTSTTTSSAAIIPPASAQPDQLAEQSSDEPSKK